MKELSNRLAYATAHTPMVTPTNLVYKLNYLVKLNVKGGSVPANPPRREHEGHTLALQEMENRRNYGYDDEYDDEHDDEYDDEYDDNYGYGYGYDDDYADGDWS